MTGTQKAILPGILLICSGLFFLNRLINPPDVAIAATAEVAAPELQDQPDQISLPEEACFFQSRYPSKVSGWCALIESSSAQYGLDPLLIASVMLVESGGQPEVISRSGAVGLLQVMPSDGVAASFQCINGPCFASRPSTSELLNPAFNVDYGTRMLAGLVSKKGDLREALKSYGPYDVGYEYADKVLNIFNGL